MALQKQVYTDLCHGVPGQAVTPTQSVYTPINYIAGEGGVLAGGFAFKGDSDRIAVNNGSTVIGLVERVIATYLYDVTESGSLQFREGEALTIAVKGDYWAKAPASVSAGDAVYCDASTGEIAESGTDTGWVYATAADADEMVVISNWAASASASGSGSGSGNQPG